MSLTPLLVSLCESVCAQLNTQMNIQDKNLASTTAALSSEIPRLCVCGLHTHAELQFWQLVHPTIVSLAEESHRTIGPLSSMKKIAKTLYIVTVILLQHRTAKDQINLIIQDTLVLSLAEAQS